MKYNIFTVTKPAMPKVPKTAKIIDLVLKNVSNDMREPLVPLIFPLLGSRISDAEFMYPDNTYKELCGQMAHLVADSGANKGRFGTLENTNFSNLTLLTTNIFCRLGGCNVNYLLRIRH